MGNRGNLIQNVDYSMILLYLVFVGLGLANIYSATFDEDYPSLFSFNKEYGKQLIWIGSSLILGLFILVLEGRFFLRTAYFYYGVIVFMLVAVLFMPAINGAHSWFGFGGVGVQPSEFAKSATALVVAKYLSTINIKMTDFRTRFRVLFIIGVPAFLILLQPDPGTVLVFVSFILMLYREGLSGNILLFGVLAGVISTLSIFLSNSSYQILSYNIGGHFFLALVIVIMLSVLFLYVKLFVQARFRKRYNLNLLIALGVSLTLIFGTMYAFDTVLKQRHRDRINLVLGLLEDKTGAGYNTNQAMAAVGSGGFSGRGYREGLLANDRFKHVPEQGTDFIFCSIGEEWGFIGGTVIVLLFLTLIIKIVTIAERQRSVFTRIYAYSVAGIFFFHFMINIGMVIGVAPVIGIPLPFFSYGGSSLWSFTILYFILVKLDSERMDVLR